MRRSCLRLWSRRSPRARIIATALLLLAPPATALAAPGCYAVDPDRSRVDFRIRYFAFFSPGGWFGRAAGRVNFDPEHWNSLAVSIRIAVDSLESRPRFWRDELLGPRFFDRARYPEISFDGARAQQTGRDSGLAYGTLTLRGASRPVKLTARLVSASGILDIEAETRVLRSDYGLGGELPLASDEVTIALHLRATPVGCDGASSGGAASPAS